MSSYRALLLRVGDGDREALAAVYDRIAPPLYRAAVARGLTDEASARFVEEVLLALWRTAPRFGRQHRSAAEWTLALVDASLPSLFPSRAGVLSER